MPWRSGPDVLPLPDAEVASRLEEDLNPDYNVILHNDDVTPMDFVVYLLMSIFGHPTPTAVSLMLEVHNTGSAVVATLPMEVAELRRDQVHSLARPRGYPLTCSVERA
jgi:ATP-dependent Clp protease adaptor protein ClpS